MQIFYNLSPGTFIPFDIDFFIIIIFVEELFSNWFNIDIIKTWLARPMWIIFVIFGRRMICRVIVIQWFLGWHLICLDLPSIMRCVFQMIRTNLSFFFFHFSPIDFYIDPVKFNGNPLIYYFFLFGPCSLITFCFIWDDLWNLYILFFNFTPFKIFYLPNLLYVLLIYIYFIEMIFNCFVLWFLSFWSFFFY